MASSRIVDSQLFSDGEFKTDVSTLPSLVAKLLPFLACHPRVEMVLSGRNNGPE